MKNVINNSNAVDQLCTFVNQRPGLNAADYISDWRDTSGRANYQREVREIAKDRSDFYQLLSVATRLIPYNELNERLYSILIKSDGRLLIQDNKIVYHVGQYFPTEYRPAACQKIVTILWNYFYTLLNANLSNVTSNDIRKYAKRYFTRRVYTNYFA